LVLETEGNTMGVLTLLHILISFTACAEAIRRADFPPSFVFGTGSSAYQVGYCNFFLVHLMCLMFDSCQCVASMKALSMRANVGLQYGIPLQEDLVQ
jgi:hypothetical protein